MSELLRTTMCRSCSMQRPLAEMRVIGTHKGGNGGVIRTFRCVWCIARRKKPTMLVDPAPSSSFLDNFQRGAEETMWLLNGNPLSAPIIMSKWLVSQSMAKSDLRRLGLIFPQIINVSGVRSMPGIARQKKPKRVA